MQYKITNKLKFFILFLILIVFQSELFSQNEIIQKDTMDLKPMFGGMIGVNLNFHNADFRSLPGVPSCCPQYTGGSGLGLYFGGVLDYPLNYIMQINARISYSQLFAQLKRYEQTTILLDGKEAVGEFEHSVDSKFSLISLEPLFSYKPIEQKPQFAVHGGFILGFLTTADYYQIEKISKPSDRGTFIDGRSYRNQSSGSLMDSANKFQFGMKIGATYQLQANKKKTLFIVPEIFYNYNFTNLVQNRDWKVSSLSIGVGLRYRIPPPPPPPPVPPVAPPDPEIKIISKQPVFAVDVDAVEIDTNKNENKQFTLNVEDFVTYNMRPLLSYVFFDENSSNIPPRYVQLDKEHSSAFDYKNLTSLDALETYYYLLNIIGKRMQEIPTANITLTGTNSNIEGEKNNKALSEERAKNVANYFTNIWGISPDRIKIQARNLPEQASKEEDAQGIQENRRVEITSDNINIIEPVFTIDTMRIIGTSQIKFIPKALTEVGVKSWDISVKQADKELFNSKDNGNLPPFVSWAINKKNIPQGSEDLAYSISAVDSIGQTAVSKTKRIPIKKKSIEMKRRSGESDKEYEYYSLILFDYGKSELQYEHKKVVDFVKGRINPDSKVYIYGFTDSMGEEEINDALSQKRAKSVLKRLDINENVQVEGKGESQLLYDNSLPEGRFYCRTVTIDIETPIHNNQNNQ